MSKVTSLGCTFISVHRLPPLLAVIAVLLAYHRSRARWESAAIALREKEGRSTPANADVIRTLGQIAQWHVEPEMKLEELRLATEEWFERGQRSIRDLGRLGNLRREQAADAVSFERRDNSLYVVCICSLVNFGSLHTFHPHACSVLSLPLLVVATHG